MKKTEDSHPALFLLGILIPTYNDYRLFTNALNSVISFKNCAPDSVNIVVSDDSSDEEVQELIRLSCIAHDVTYTKGARSGAAQNWNKFTLLDSSYIWVLHHDEYYLGSHMDLLDILKRSRRARASSCFVLRSKFHTYAYHPKLSSFLINAYSDTILYSNYIGAPSCVIFPSSANIRFTSAYPYIVDVIFYWKLRSICRIFFCPISDHECHSIPNSGSITSAISTSLTKRHRYELFSFLFSEGLPYRWPANFLARLITLLMRHL
jgi:glycosyltransferase involved in cell wall biosynthesis